MVFLPMSALIGTVPEDAAPDIFVYEVAPEADSYYPSARLDLYPSSPGNGGYDFSVIRGIMPGTNSGYGWYYFIPFTEVEHTDNDQWWIKVDIVEQVSGISTITFKNGSNLGEWVDFWDDWEIDLWDNVKNGIPEEIIADVSFAPDNGAGAADTANATVYRTRFLSYRGGTSYVMRDLFGTSGDLDGDLPTHADRREGVSTTWLDLYYVEEDYDHGYIGLNTSGAESRAGSTSDESLYIIDSGLSTGYRYSTSMHFGTNEDAGGLAFRVQDTANFWMVAVKNPESTNPVFGLYEVVAGTHTLKDSVECTGLGPFESFDLYYIRITIVGNVLEGEIGFTDSTVAKRVTKPYVVTATDSNFTTETNVGLWADGVDVTWTEIVLFKWPVGIDPVKMDDTAVTASVVDTGYVVSNVYASGSSNDPNSVHATCGYYIDKDTYDFFDLIDFEVAGGYFGTDQFVAKVTAVSGGTGDVEVREYASTLVGFNTWFDAYRLDIRIVSDEDGYKSAVVDLTIGVDDGSGGSLSADYEKTKRITIVANSTGP